MLRLAQHANLKKKTYTMNLSAPFLCTYFKDPMMKPLPYVDFLFGNESEAAEFAKVHEYGTEDVKQIALKMADWPKEDKRRPRTVVITQGAECTIVAKEGKVTEYPVLKLAPSQIVDTNGAGDGFVAGFLAQPIQGKSIDECVRCGTYM